MISVIKSDGSIQPFSQQKVLSSMMRAGIPQEIETLVLKHVKSKLYDNIPTSKIYQHVLEFLDTSSRPYSKARYSLKRAIMELGPTGFPFEDFVAEVLKALGYKTDLRQVLDGKCIKHEIDIIAQKQETKSIIECKFHNRVGNHTDVHVSLYTKARFDDLKDVHNFSDVWLVTNTKITTDALDYAMCNNMRVISWNYPQRQGLRDLIEKSHLHPITALTTISQNQKQNLLNNRVVLCKDISKNSKLLGLSEGKKRSILEEAKFVCNL